MNREDREFHLFIERNKEWLPFVVVGGVLLMCFYFTDRLREQAFKEGIDCIVQGDYRGSTFSTPKICADYYSDRTRDLRSMIETSPDTKLGNIESGIWIRHLNDVQYLRENGLKELFFKGPQ